MIINEELNKIDFNIIGKGNKVRLVSIAYSLVKDDLLECLKDSTNNYLFTSLTGKQINDRYVGMLVDKVREVTGKKKKKMVHIF